MAWSSSSGGYPGRPLTGNDKSRQCGDRRRATRRRGLGRPVRLDPAAVSGPACTVPSLHGARHEARASRGEMVEIRAHPKPASRAGELITAPPAISWFAPGRSHHACTINE
jgi:hypothetical protein